MPTATQSPNETTPATSPRSIGGKVGAATAAVVFFSMLMIPATIGALMSSATAAWWPVILISALPGTVIAAVVGGIVGRIAGKTTNSTAGAMIGIAVSFPIGFVFAIVFNSSVEPWDEFIGTIVYATVPGAFAGAVAGLFARSISMGLRRLRISLADGALFVGLLILTGVWYGHLYLESRARSQISAVGGAVTWNAIVDKPGVWVVTLQGDRVDDSELERLLPTLARYPRLDLDLGQSKVTDASVTGLAGLSNLFRIRLYGTVVSDDGVAKLKGALPKLQVQGESVGR